MIVRDVMTPHPSVVTVNDTAAHAARVMRDHHVGVLPVVDDLCHRRLAGVVTDRDLATRCAARGGTAWMSVQDCMTAEGLVTLQADVTATAVLPVMRHRRLRRIPVVDADGRVVGIVTRNRVARQLAGAARSRLAPRPVMQRSTTGMATAPARGPAGATGRTTAGAGA